MFISFAIMLKLNVKDRDSESNHEYLGNNDRDTNHCKGHDNQQIGLLIIGQIGNPSYSNI
ncbi:MAG: hypothetical protein EGP82_04330 [Odoribacter splanchnicus]|nr:hypothetical protein [Odoribacter splanchnicus]